MSYRKLWRAVSNIVARNILQRNRSKVVIIIILGMQQIINNTPTYIYL